MLLRAALDPRIIRWLAAGAGVLIAVGGTLTVLVLLGRDAGGGRPPAEPTLGQDAALLLAPSTSAPAVMQLGAGSRLRLLGRSEDSQWLAVSPAERPEIVGWLQVTAVRNAPLLAALPVLTALPDPRAATQAPRPSNGAPPDERPDLAVQGVGAKQNRLEIVIGNVGRGNYAGPIFVTINDSAPPRRVDVGRPLRRGEALAVVVFPPEFVQRRGLVSVAVAPQEGVHEERDDNNRLEAVVTPDVPNDLELASATVDSASGRLVVAVRNLSPIPLVGVITIAVRESPPTNRLLAVQEAELDVLAGATQRIEVRAAAPVDLTRATVTVSTDAIADANAANDRYPR